MQSTPCPFPAQNPAISVVLPVCNEAENLDILYQRLCATLASMKLASYELLFVDDGSTDASLSVLRRIQAQDPQVHVLKLSRNFGHHLAVTAGIDHAQGDAIVLMDADLQDQPEEIPRLYQKLQEGFGVVYGIRKHKQFSAHKRFLSAGFRWVMKRWLGYPIEGGIFRIIHRDVAAEIRRCRELDRIVIGLTSWVGFAQTGIDVTHSARGAGQTKYTLRKQLQLAANAMLAFSTKPLLLSLFAGVTFCALGLLDVLWLSWHQWQGQPPQGWSWLLAALVLMGGIQLISTGILGAYLGRVFRETRHRPLYIIEALLSHRSPTTGGGTQTDVPGDDGIPQETVEP